MDPSIVVPAMQLRRHLGLLGLLGLGCAQPPPPARPEAPPGPRAAPTTVPARGRWATGVPEPWTTAPIGAPAATAPPDAGRLVELRVDGTVKELSVAPGGALWLTTDRGRAYRSDGFGAPWQPAALDCVGADGRRAPCDRVTFFTDRAAVATGYIGARIDEYYVTDSGGRTWERRSFGGPDHADGQWIYDVFATAGGEAWMGGSHGYLLHSADFGRTWTRRAAPFDRSHRLARIFMAGRRGLAGALGNQLKRTDDGGRTWTALPTPLDQRATTGAVGEAFGDDRIENVALFGEWMLVQQNERVYASPRAAARWRPLAGLVAFACDRDGRRVFAVTRERGVVALDRALAPTRLDGVRLRSPVLDLHVEGDALYVLDEALGLHRIAPAGARFTALLTRGDGPRSIFAVRRAGDRLWGISPHGIYASDDGGARWQLRHASERRWLGLAARAPGELLVWDDAGAVERFDDRAGRLQPVPELAGTRVHAVVARGDRWLALGAGEQGGEVWRSTDAGAAWTVLDRGSGAPAREAYPLTDARTLLWTSDHRLRGVPGPEGSHAAPSEPVQLLGRAALYFVDPRRGFLRGYLHHGGDRAWATEDGGATWEPVARDEFPYLLVVPYRDGALAVVGDSFSSAEDDRRELHLLAGGARSVVHRADVAVSDVSVDPDGRILLELDPEPDSDDDGAGKRWVELVPPSDRRP
jgi:photosystem II stability/assembly factor-like uncharacterized protein